MNPDGNEVRDVKKKRQYTRRVGARKPGRPSKRHLVSARGNGGVVLYLFGPNRVFQTLAYKLPIQEKEAYCTVLGKDISRKL